ncbi:MAG: elongation factor P [Puniceicoccales bacterium]|jgi:elongation factor P|nr:elongation factor P [Puniceicoccales bacterium]
MASPTDIRKGKVIDYQGVPHTVLEVQHRTQGRQAGFVQVAMRNTKTGASTSVKFLSSDSVNFLTTTVRSLEYSYVDESGHHFLDLETFEDVVLPESMISTAKKFMVTGIGYDIQYIENKPVEISLPPSVSMKVVESPEGVRGDTASSVQKPAKTESGLVVQVPLFIKEGDTIRISTADGSYMSRA